MKRTHTADTRKLSGRRYELDTNDHLHVFPGLAYRRHHVADETPYYTSINPARIDELTDGAFNGGEEITETIYMDTGGAYVHEQVDVPSYSITRYLIGDTIYRLDERINVIDDRTYHADSDEPLQTTEYARLVNGWSHVDDIVIPLADLEDDLSNGTIKRLWPVWSDAE